MSTADLPWWAVNTDKGQLIVQAANEAEARSVALNTPVKKQDRPKQTFGVSGPADSLEAIKTVVALSE